MRKPAPPAQTCFEYDPFAVASRLESQRPETRRRAAARDKSPRTRDPVTRWTAHDAEPARRRRRKKCSTEMAARPRLLARQLRSRHSAAVQAGQQNCGRIRGWLRAPLGAAALPCPPRALLRLPKRVLPGSIRTESRGAAASA